MKNPGIAFLSSVLMAGGSFLFFLSVTFAQWGFHPSTWPAEGRGLYAFIELCISVLSLIIGFTEGHKLNDLFKEDT